MSTMTAAAQGAESAVDFERRKLAQLREEERILTEEIDKSVQRTQELSTLLGTVGRDALAQQERVALVEQTMADHAEALVRVMAELRLEPQEITPNPLGMVQGQDARSPIGDRVEHETTSTRAFPVVEQGAAVSDGDA